MNQNKTGHFTCYKNRTFSFATDMYHCIGTTVWSQLFTVDKSLLKNRINHLSATQMQRFDAGLRMFFRFDYAPCATQAA